MTQISPAVPYIAPADLLAAPAASTDALDLSVFTTEQLTEVIAEAQGIVEDAIGHPIYRRILREHYRGRGKNMMKLRQYPLWDGMQTTLTAAAASGATTVALADVTGLLAGHYLALGAPSASGTFSYPILAVTPDAGDAGGTVLLGAALGGAAAAGSAAFARPVDYIDFQLPLQVERLYLDGLLYENELGIIRNWTPLMIQSIGYTVAFPKAVPLIIQYTAGYDQTPAGVRTVLIDLCRDMLLARANKARGGVTQERSGDESRTYTQGTSGQRPGSLAPDQLATLLRYRCL